MPSKSGNPVKVHLLAAVLTVTVAGNCLAAREREERGGTPPWAEPRSEVTTLSGRNVIADTRDQISVGGGDIVLEPELFHSQTYGWQIGESGDASGGCYLHIKEGVGDFESEDLLRDDPSVRSGDFYNITRDTRPIEARMYFIAPEEGVYHLSARTMAHKTDCSNVIGARVNSGSKLRIGRNGTRPFVWLWHYVSRVSLKKGLNVISFLTFQDDVKVDQLVLSRERLDIDEGSETTYGGGFGKRPVSGPEIPAVTMSLTFDTMNVTDAREPTVHLYVRKDFHEAIGATLIVSLDLPGGKRRKSMFDLRLRKSQELIRFSIPVGLSRVPDMREYLLTCTLVVDSKVMGQKTLVFCRGYDWSILGPLPYLSPEQEGPEDGRESPAASCTVGGKAFTWSRYDMRHTDPFCLMDFRKAFGKSLVPGSTAALYAYTEVKAREAGVHLLKVQGDDNIVVWLNGREVAEITKKGPPIRTAREVRVSLKKGRNVILFRLNQKKAQWQAAIRVRTINDGVADVTGVPFEEQNAKLLSP